MLKQSTKYSLILILKQCLVYSFPKASDISKINFLVIIIKMAIETDYGFWEIKEL